MIIRKKFITRQDVQNNPDKLYVFGDNMLGVGMGGQAGQMRGEPNAIGFPTKWKPTNESDAFFRDDMTERQMSRVAARWFDDLLFIQEAGQRSDIVIPADGLGTGLSRMPEFAPDLLCIIETKIGQLEEAYGVRYED